MAIANLHKLFSPESIAVIGAGEQPGSIGAALINNLLAGGYKGRILPVNPNYTCIRGLEAVDSISRATGIDLAVIAVSIKKVPDILKDCGEAGVRAAIIISAGGKETGPRGLALEKQISDIASRANIRILGPNCLGIMVPCRKAQCHFCRRYASQRLDSVRFAKRRYLRCYPRSLPEGENRVQSLCQYWFHA